MKLRYMREKTLWTALAFVLAILVMPALFADEQKRTVPNTGGHNSTPQTHSAPATRSAPTHTPAQHTAPPSHNNPTPQTHTPPAGGGTHNPSGSGGYNPARTTNSPGGGTHTPSTTNPGGTGNRNPGYNPGGTHTPSMPAGTPNAAGSGNRNPGYNPGGAGNRNSGGNNPGGTGTRNPGYNPGGNNPGGNTGNRNPGYNPAGTTNRNPGGNTGNRNSGYNPGGNTGNRNPGGPSRTPFRPPTGAQASSRPGGGMSYAHNGATYHTDPRGQLTHYSRPGAEARFSNSGRVSYAHFSRPDHSQVYVNRGPRGERTIVTVRADRSRVVSYGPRYGYYERPLGGRPGYVSRTFVYGGRPYVHVYHSYGWRGVTYYRYVPPVYYAPAFYGWAWSPWRAPIVFGWGWRRDPWFGFYGGYFTPAPVYPTASLWLTDYLLAENLRLAYESRQAALQSGQPAPPPEEYQQQGAAPVTLTPEIKAAIAEEVRQQLEAERAAASAPQQGGGYNQPTGGYPPQQQAPGGYAPTGGEAPPPALDPKQRIFVVSTNLDVTVVGGQGCALTPGDIILRTGDTVVNGSRVGVSVLSSKPGDCPCNSATEVDLVALQEMHNQFREQIDSGMKQLAENQGKNGLPPAPAAGPRLVAEGQAPADQASTVEQALAQQQSDASQAEQEVQQAANSAQ
jgi:hypothetical protein